MYIVLIKIYNFDDLQFKNINIGFTILVDYIDNNNYQRSYLINKKIVFCYMRFGGDAISYIQINACALVGTINSQYKGHYTGLLNKDYYSTSVSYHLLKLIDNEIYITRLSSKSDDCFASLIYMIEN